VDKILLVGLGKSNKSAYKVLINRGYIVDCLVDDEFKEDGYNYVSFNEININSYLYIVRSPGISYYHKFYDLISGMENVISEIELAYILSNKRGKYIGITGSNGKTTSVTLLKEMLDTKYNDVILAGNIGYPLCDYVDKINDNSIIILELSSFQLENIDKLHFHISVILSLCPNHLDSVPSLEYYYSSKFNIAKNQETCDLLIYPYEYKKYLRNNDVTTINIENISYEFDTKLVGDFNKKNISIMYHIALMFNVEEKEIKKVILNFDGLEYRMQYLTKIKNTIFINDSKSTTVDSTLACYNAYIGTKLLICGGKNKNINFSRLDSIKNKCIFGEIRTILHGYRKENLKELYSFIKENYNNFDYVIFSPGTSSLDQYSSYKERGICFNELVKRLKDEEDRI